MVSIANFLRLRHFYWTPIGCVLGVKSGKTWRAKTMHQSVNKFWNSSHSSVAQISTGVCWFADMVKVNLSSSKLWMKKECLCWHNFTSCSAYDLHTSGEQFQMNGRDETLNQLSLKIWFYVCGLILTKLCIFPPLIMLSCPIQLK